MLKILIPENKQHFQDAASIFAELYEAVTGNVLEIIRQDDPCSDLICFGTDADSVLIYQWMMDKKIPNFSICYGTDSYQILSATIDQRKVLFLTGGNVRASFYAVYDFFERAAGCHWFWDGDRIPKAEHISIDGWDVQETPRFEYRGLRYFAHRGLMRFQAEHWDFEDWKKEFDWVLKKRLNLAMLRIGVDDLFQQAFPQVVSYPDWKKP